MTKRGRTRTHPHPHPQLCSPVISPRNLKSVQEWLATAGPDDKESFRRIFAGVHRPRDPRFLTAPLAPATTRPAPEEPPRPRTAASRCASRSGLPEGAAAARLAARIRDALPCAGAAAGAVGDSLARLLSGGDPAGLTDPARVLEVAPRARSGQLGCCRDT